VGFFDDIPLPEPSPEEDLEEPDQPEWTGPPSLQFGVSVALDRVILHNDDVAVAATRFAAYRNGVAFTLQVRRRRWQVERGDPFEGEDRLRFGVQLSDGRKTSTDANWWDDPEDGDIRLMQGGGAFGGPEIAQDMWLWPLPPPGPLLLACVWPAGNVPEAVVELDASPLVEAAGRAVDLWP
jgi:hypothetical protein